MSAAAHSDGTVGKALDVLDQVAAFGRPVRFAEVLANSPFPKATLYRFLQTLTSQSMLAYDPDRQTYSLGLRLVRLAHDAWQQSSLAPIARPVLMALSRDVGATVHLAQLDSGQVLYVDKISARDPIEMYSQAGKVGPAYCTGVGKAMMAWLAPEALTQVMSQQSFYAFTDSTITSPADLLADLQGIRETGYCFDREEHEPGIICVAVPILSANDRVLGAVSVTSTTGRTSLAALEDHVPRLQAAARAVSDAYACWQVPEASQTTPPS